MLEQQKGVLVLLLWKCSLFDRQDMVCFRQSIIVGTAFLLVLPHWRTHSALAAAEDDVASSMPRLPNGKHLGALTGFDAYPPEVHAALDARLEEMRAAIGMGNPVVQRVQLDWRDLEPGAPGVYDTAPLVEALDYFNDDNDFIFVLLATVDTEGIQDARPTDLEQTPFADGILWQRFQNLLQRAVIPILEANERVFLLSVGNEPGGYIEENPTELLPLATFLNQTRAVVHETIPSLAVGLTMDRIYAEIADASDVVIFNQYGLKSDLTIDFLTAIDSPQDFVTELRERQSIFGVDRPFVIQELGMPSGWEHQDSILGTDPEYAAQVVQVMIQEFRENPSWRVAFWFTTVDWSIEITDLYLGVFAADDTVPEIVVLRLAEWLRTGGLLRYQQPATNGTSTTMDSELLDDELSPRPVWEEFLQGLESISEANVAQGDGAATRSPTETPSPAESSHFASFSNPRLATLVFVILVGWIFVEAEA